ncbi:cytochrome d ubiquinol oxidase subunit I [Thermosporothrix hazakensis]|jgi:cytochrome d ubiquinol oxidase subunit I|uniref:Cytochrome d ubiquinol oxidase subunit I n=2 Tax=Thermosporothrix TaxID=768650 RepID=A0A326U8Q3_THEHA|nr:cytochrome ubiquinol oxidase subunit I [Thermosporothrix hazakensis]PZW22931.1 cytochrome d ubiquinol oxidase subunit I [Thermosporothrix hazakensis]BBH89791.1 cytochrome ubiquinol oxidase subunit I [Thermosporothrix sp. COM3]GCE47980.1 cytochrome ubiquinol oxidase subunit I [Thermosporothrix hazakensis]
MDPVTLARLQFGTTIVYHYLFVPLTLGLGLMIAIMETIYVRSGNDTYKRMAQFWGKLFLINFAMGVVTGIVQEFQFGMNWSEHSRFVGDIIGAPLAIEGILAFFIESTFLGLWMFGWGHLPKKIHLATIWMVVLGTHLSTFWILVANSFMQNPVGYTIRNGRAELTDFQALITNPQLWVRLPHIIAGGLVTGAFFVIAVSAYHLLKKRGATDFFHRSAKIGIIAALIGSIVVTLAGHFQGQYLVHIQPMKTAASEGLWETENPAGLSLFSIIDEKNQRNIVDIQIPFGLSFMLNNTFTGEVKGIKDLQAQYENTYGPGNYIPPVNVSYWSFRFMVGAGVLMILFSLAAAFLLWKKQLAQKRFFLILLICSIVLPYVANAGGWILTEMGRQPWLVYGVEQTAHGVSTTVSAGMILFTLSIYVLLYAALAVVDGFIMIKFARKQVETEEIIVKPDEIHLLGVR